MTQLYGGSLLWTDVVGLVTIGTTGVVVLYYALPLSRRHGDAGEGALPVAKLGARSTPSAPMATPKVSAPATGLFGLPELISEYTTEEFVPPDNLEKITAGQPGDGPPDITGAPGWFDLADREATTELPDVVWTASTTEIPPLGTLFCSAYVPRWPAEPRSQWQTVTYLRWLSSVGSYWSEQV